MSTTAPSSTASQMSSTDTRFETEAKAKLKDPRVQASLRKQKLNLDDPKVLETLQERFTRDAERKASRAVGPQSATSKRARRSKSKTGDTETLPSVAASSKPTAKSPRSRKSNSNSTVPSYIPEEESLRHIATSKKKRQTGVPLSARGSSRVHLEGGLGTTMSTDPDSKGWSLDVSIVRHTPEESMGIPTAVSAQSSSPSTLTARPYTTAGNNTNTTALFGQSTGTAQDYISPLDAHRYQSNTSNNSGGLWSANSPSEQIYSQNSGMGLPSMNTYNLSDWGGAHPGQTSYAQNQLASYSPDDVRRMLASGTSAGMPGNHYWDPQNSMSGLGWSQLGVA